MRSSARATGAAPLKLAEKAYRDVNIAFANELSLICERLGLDVWEIRACRRRLGPRLRSASGRCWLSGGRAESGKQPEPLGYDLEQGT